MAARTRSSRTHVTQVNCFRKLLHDGRSCHGAVETNPTRNYEVAGLIPGLAQWCCMGCGVGRRRGSDPSLLWLWCRPAATAPIGPRAWEPLYAAGAALKKTKEKKKISTWNVVKELYSYMDGGA